MLSQAKDQFLNYLKSVKNASIHTVRNYVIYLDSLEKFIEFKNKNKLPIELETIDRKVRKGQASGKYVSWTTSR